MPYHALPYHDKGPKSEKRENGKEKAEGEKVNKGKGKGKGTVGLDI